MTATTRRPLIPWSIRTERRLHTPKWLPIATTISAVAVALVLSGLLIAVIGGDPMNIGRHLLVSSFGSVGVLSDTLVKATPLIFTGLACALAFRMRLWNIGAEGQLFMGAWGASVVVLAPLLPADSSPFVLIPAMLAAGFLAGALWGGLAGWLKARFNVNEIITTLMLNYIAILWVRFWVFGPWSEGGFQQSARFPRGAWLPRLTDFADAMPDLGRPHHASRLRHRPGVRIPGLVPAQADPQGLRDPPHRRQPEGGPICGYQHRSQCHPGHAHVGRAGRPGGGVRGRRRRPPAPGRHLGRLRLHGHDHRLPRPVQPVRRGHRIDPVRGVRSSPVGRSSRPVSPP